MISEPILTGSKTQCFRNSVFISFSDYRKYRFWKTLLPPPPGYRISVTPMIDCARSLTVNVERDFSVDVPGQLRVGTLAHVRRAVHFGRHVERHLDGGQLAAVEPGLGETVEILGDLNAVPPQGHFHTRIAGRSLARQRGLVPEFHVRRIVSDVQVLGKNCEQ